MSVQNAFTLSEYVRVYKNGQKIDSGAMDTSHTQ